VIGRPLQLDEATIKLALDPAENVRVRSIIGGPAPEEVSRAISVGRGLLGHDRQRLAQREGQLEQGVAKLAAAVKAITG
jgi:argininosuccinate lyase